MLTAKKVYHSNIDLFCTLCEYADNCGNLWIHRNAINDLTLLIQTIGQQKVVALGNQCLTYAEKNKLSCY